MSERLDNLMLAKGLVKSRSQAKMLIKQGDVLVNGEKILKSGKLVPLESEIQIKERDLYVSRGAYKLLKAIEEFKINFSGTVVADCGASTGGFTQVCLQYGARHVYAIDVGHDQLDQILLNNPRVTNKEGVNLKHSYDLPEKVDFCVCDISFISLKLVYATIHSLLKPGGQSIVLIKPQFEAGKDRLGKGGLVKEEDQEIILNEVLDWFKHNDYKVHHYCESPIKGNKTGNREFLALIS